VTRFVSFPSRQPKRRPTVVADDTVEKAGESASNPALERAIVNAYLQAVQQFRNGIDTSRVADAIRTSIEATLKALPTGGLISDMRPIVDGIVKEIIASSRKEAKSLQVGVRGVFDVTDTRAVQWATERAGELVKDVTDEVVELIQDTVEDVLEGNISVAEAQKRLRRQVGLHERWRKAVENSYARTLESYRKSGMTEDDARLAAQKASEKYQDRLVKARAKNIARTEVATAQNEGRWQAWQEAQDVGLVDLNKSWKEWRTAPEFVSSKTVVCAICAPLDGKRIPVNDNFQTGLRSQPDGIKMPPAHPSCRCRAVLVTLSFEEIERRVMEQRRREARG
jgi:hypothetical protein